MKSSPCVALLFVVLFALSSASALALPTTVPALAKFDVGFQQCEKLYPEMRGQRDEAYAGVWKLRLDDKARSDLAAARKSAVYKAEQQRASAAIVRSDAPELTARLKQQCQAVRNEARRAAPKGP